MERPGHGRHQRGIESATEEHREIDVHVALPAHRLTEDPVELVERRRPLFGAGDGPAPIAFLPNGSVFENDPFPGATFDSIQGERGRQVSKLKIASDGSGRDGCGLVPGREQCGDFTCEPQTVGGAG